MNHISNPSIRFGSFSLYFFYFLFSIDWISSRPLWVIFRLDEFFPRHFFVRTSMMVTSLFGGWWYFLFFFLLLSATKLKWVARWLVLILVPICMWFTSYFYISQKNCLIETCWDEIFMRILAQNFDIATRSFCWLFHGIASKRV